LTPSIIRQHLAALSPPASSDDVLAEARRFDAPYSYDIDGIYKSHNEEENGC